ncbi:recombinase family protein [Streptomyces sp. NBC_01381]|uniref:recombinase family protein n=1 Tax=Streptomyces sp. NBC_01381 TaxID=2903845 RepID=UPI0022511D9E|nr:recombinase family protein [Streptomyces sp. NBC_01381]MCX4666570.1 recombinase family protein [Streptomyces sp. NBC_01381]
MSGYASDGVLNRPEAAFLRKAASRLFDRQSQNAVVRWLNEQGHTTARGNQWRREVLIRLFKNPKIAGLDESGQPIEGWDERVLEPEEFRLLLALFAEQSEVRSQPREAYDYLLTRGCAICDNCEFAMIGARVTADAPPSYRCPSPSGDQKSCGRVRMNADRLEDTVAEQVLAELLKPGAVAELEALLRDVEAEIARLRKHIEGAEERFTSIGDLHGRGLMVEAAFIAAQKANKEDLRSSRARLRYLEQITDVPPIGDVKDLVAWWNSAPHARKRALVLLEVEQVWVMPQPEGSGDPHDRIRIQWRQAAA